MIAPRLGLASEVLPLSRRSCPLLIRRLFSLTWANESQLGLSTLHRPSFYHFCLRYRIPYSVLDRFVIFLIPLLTCVNHHPNWSVPASGCFQLARPSSESLLFCPVNHHNSTPQDITSNPNRIRRRLSDDHLFCNLDVKV